MLKDDSQMEYCQQTYFVKLSISNNFEPFIARFWSWFSPCMLTVACCEQLIRSFVATGKSYVAARQTIACFKLRKRPWTEFNFL